MDDGGAVGLFGHVGGVEEGAAAGGLDLADGFGAGLGVAVGDDDGGAFLGEGEGDAAPDAGAGASDDGDFVFEADRLSPPCSPPLPRPGEGDEFLVGFAHTHQGRCPWTPARRWGCG